MLSETDSELYELSIWFVKPNDVEEIHPFNRTYEEITRSEIHEVIDEFIDYINDNTILRIIDTDIRRKTK